MPGQKLGDFSIYSTIAKGRFSKIRYGEVTATKEPVAVKSYDTTKLESLGLLEDIKKEIAIMKLLSHVNVIGIHEVFATQTRIYIVMDYMNGKNLQELLAQEIQLKESSGRFYFQQIISGLEYCHSVGITHENLKLECILLNLEGQVKISDFSKAYLDIGNSNDNDNENEDENNHHHHDNETNRNEFFHSTHNDDNLSTITENTNQTNNTNHNIHNHRVKISTKGIQPSYIAPEIIDDNCIDRTKIDCWNLAIMLYTCTAGYLPFESLDDDLIELFKSIRIANYREFPKYFSNEIRDLLESLLVSDPAERLSLNEIKKKTWFLSPEVTYDAQYLEELDYATKLRTNSISHMNSNSNTKSSNSPQRRFDRKVIVSTETTSPAGWAQTCVAPDGPAAHTPHPRSGSARPVQWEC